METAEALPTPPRSSQDAGPTSSLVSSPSRPAKRRGKPTVTPRTFRRFFTPRNAIEAPVTTRLALTDLTAGQANMRNASRREPGQPKRQVFDEDENPPQGSNLFDDASLRLPSPTSSPDRWLPADGRPNGKRKRGAALLAHSSNLHASRTARPATVMSSAYRGLLGARSMREAGLVNGRLSAYLETPWQSHVANFCSREEDVHFVMDMTDSGLAFALPFCTTACHTNALVAVGDEEGCVRLLDTERGPERRMRRAFLAFQPHCNAVLDMDFSADDYYLATASGDQSSLIIDMHTQQSTHCLRGHLSSVKQVRFQPGNGHNVIATSSRDGSVMIWDLRCRGTAEQRPDLTVQLGGREAEAAFGGPDRAQQLLAASVGTIPAAHSDSLSPLEASQPTKYNLGGMANATRRVTQALRQEISVTAIQFLPASPHVLLTGSEASATVKLWDLRAKQQPGGKKWLPLSVTRQPEAHNRHRQFGLTSMSLNSDSSRLYTLCKDHTIYAYSINHLLLGTVPEMDSGAPWKRRQESLQGLGPLYALRHPKLRASNFYIKSALRASQNGNSEVLAVGSTEGCAVLFPTDERCISRPSPPAPTSSLPSEIGSSPLNPTLTPSARSVTYRSRAAKQGLPVSYKGTALVRGHDKEVTGLTWSSEGELITVSDDLKCRVWREDAEHAHSVRAEGESGGERWQQGWADIQAEDPRWDEDE